MTSIKRFKPKLVNSLDSLVAHLQADEETPAVEWQAVMIAREVVASSGAVQLAKAIEVVKGKVAAIAPTWGARIDE
jgi:hypothetical protein